MSESLSEKLARLTAEREAREAAKVEAAREKNLEAELRAAEALPALEEKYPDGVRSVRTVCGPVIVRGPTQVQYRNFKKALNVPDQRADAMRVMVTACVLYPSFDDFEAYAKTKPGIIDILADHVCELGGVVATPKV